jgi:hypothetical protein
MDIIKQAGGIGTIVIKGSIDCSGNPNYPAANAGDIYVVSVAGKIGGASGVSVDVGDWIVCNVDGTPSGTQAAVGANWAIVPLSNQTEYTNANPVLTTLGGITAGMTFSSVPYDTMWTNLLYPYIAPAITLVSSIAGGLREYGDNQVDPTLTATTVKKTNNITSVKFYRGPVLIDDNTPPAFPTGGAEVFPYTYTISTPQTFTATATDGTATTTSNTISYTFCYPFFYGSGAAGLTGAAIYAAFNPAGKIIQNQANTTKAFAPVGQYYYFCYPDSIPALSVITADFTVRTVSITGLDGTAQTYKVYEYNNLTSLAQNLTFNF